MTAHQDTARILLDGGEQRPVEVLAWFDPRQLDLVLTINVAGVCVWRQRVLNIGARDFDPMAANGDVAGTTRKVEHD